MATMQDVKAFADYGNEPEFDAVDAGFYQLEVSGYDLFYAEDGGTQLQLNTRIVGGDHDGKMGPTKFLNPNADKYTFKGREIVTTQEEARKKFYYAVKHINDDQNVTVTAPLFSDEMLEEVGAALEGCVFIGKVTVGDNGRNRLGAVYSLSDPPKKWKAPVDTEGVTI